MLSPEEVNALLADLAQGTVHLDVDPRVSASSTEKYGEHMAEHVRLAQVAVRVMLGRAEIGSQQLEKLQEGDILPLDTAAGGPLPVFVEDQLKFHARPGRSGDRLAMVVTDVVEGERR